MSSRTRLASSSPGTRARVPAMGRVSTLPARTDSNRSGDELTTAQRQGRLHRNFQGYSTYAECDLMAFGVSAIGKVGPTYAQNVKTLDEYYDILDTGRLPVLRGIELTADDLLRRAIIQALMCHFELSIESIEIAHLIDSSSISRPSWPTCARWRRAAC